MRIVRLAPLLMAAAFASGCGGDESEPPSGEAAGKKAEPVGKRVAGSVVQFADCEDWRAGSRAEREATVLELRDQLTAQSSASNESPLTDERAYAILQKACKSDFASGLRLYKLYVRAQGFAPLRE